MLDMRFILQKLQLDGQAVTSAIIADLIKDNMSVRAEMVRKYKAYKADGLPILSRQASNVNKSNNKLVHDFRGEIVDQLTGYLCGNPVTYSLSVNTYPDQEGPEYKKHLQVLKDFKRLNKLEELDAETVKMMSACGRAARLLYIDRAGKERAMHVDPWECIFIYDQSLDEVQYALRYYTVYEMRDGTQISRTRVEWYDDHNVSYYISTDNGYIPDFTDVMLDSDISEISSQPHQFDRVPLIDFQNNRELLCDFEKTESLIDGYDRVVSDAQNEIEDLRLAYLLFFGVTPDDKSIAAAKQLGAFGCDKGDKIEYLTKDINDVFVENQKKTLRENIYRFSKTVDVTADTFTGSGASGEARKWLLLALENRGSKTALKLKFGIDRMFQVVASAWRKKGITIDPAQIEIAIDRNLPVELRQESEIQSMLKGNVSDRTRLSLFSPVRDVDEEMRQIEKENELRVNLDNVPIDDTNGDSSVGADAGAGAPDGKQQAQGAGQ